MHGNAIQGSRPTVAPTVNVQCKISRWHYTNCRDSTQISLTHRRAYGPRKRQFEDMFLATDSSQTWSSATDDGPLGTQTPMLQCGPADHLVTYLAQILCFYAN